MDFSYDDAKRLDFYRGCGYLPQIITTQVALKHSNGVSGEIGAIHDMIKEVSPIVGIGRDGVFAVPKGRFYAGSNPEKGDELISIGDMTRLIARSSGKAVYVEPDYLAVYGMVNSTPSLVEVQGVSKYLSLEISQRMREIGEMEDDDTKGRMVLNTIISEKAVKLKRILGDDPIAISTLNSKGISAKRILCASIKELINPFAEIFNPMFFEAREMEMDISEQILSICEEIIEEYTGRSS